MKVLDQASGAAWALYNADNMDVMRELPESSIHLTVTSIPYLSLFTYSAQPRDVGNCESDTEFWKHFGYQIREMFRVTRPGRIVAIDCMNVPAMKEKDGYIGLKDFRGDIIAAFVRAGFIFHSEHCIWKDPLIEATRTKALGLMHKQLMKDSAMCRAGIPQYLLAFRKPGQNQDPVAHLNGLDEFFGEDPPTSGNLSHERWRRYASPVWMDIDFTDTLNAAAAREEDDERHVCPFALGIVRRALALWSNPGDTVFDPFAGIGSVGYVAVQEGRRSLAAELKGSYFEQAKLNMQRATSRKQAELFA